jgi:hypothetical protein
MVLENWLRSVSHELLGSGLLQMLAYIKYIAILRALKIIPHADLSCSIIYPWIRLMMRTMHSISWSPSLLLSDNIRLEDFLGKTHNLQWTYFRHYEVCCFISSSNYLLLTIRDIHHDDTKSIQRPPWRARGESAQLPNSSEELICPHVDRIKLGPDCRARHTSRFINPGSIIESVKGRMPSWLRFYACSTNKL